ncbi:hypothetical protein D3C80_1869760 [compost metagenome]
MTQRYKATEELDGTWTVIDTRTKRPAEMGSRTVNGMNAQDAGEFAELLNKLDAQRQET